jgi:hypothetical protein
VGGEVRWSLTCDPDGTPSLALVASYDFSWLRYISLGQHPVLGHNLSAGLVGAY